MLQPTRYYCVKCKNNFEENDLASKVRATIAALRYQEYCYRPFYAASIPVFICPRYRAMWACWNCRFEKEE